MTPRVTREQIEEYIDNETTDVEKLFEVVIDFYRVRMHRKSRSRNCSREWKKRRNGKRTTLEDIRSFNETYKEIALNCFRYLDFKNFDQVDLLSFAEYELLMKQ
mgnify:CR=1 FL=1